MAEPALVLRLAVLLAGLPLSGCSVPHAWIRGASSEPGSAVAPSRMVALAQARAIVQENGGDHARFVLVAKETAPTPKTLATSSHTASSSSESLRSGPAATPNHDSPADRRRVAKRTHVRQPAGSVYFAVAETRLRESALPTLAAAARRTGRSDRLVLTAYTDPLGSLRENARLAESRADSVASALVNQGIDPAQVIVLSRPQCCVAATEREREYASYRRVDIEILTTQEHASEEGGDGQARHS